MRNHFFRLPPLESFLVVYTSYLGHTSKTTEKKGISGLDVLIALVGIIID